jgi:AcrR family transcriptional regulator
MPKIVDHDVRREELAAALWTLIRRDGIERVSVRSVAAEAGVSAGSLRHYFPSQAELIGFAMELVEARTRDRIGRLDLSGTARVRVTALAEVVLPLDVERGEDLQVWFALTARARHDPALHEVSGRAYDALLDLARSVVGELEASAASSRTIDTELEAVTLHALLDGLAVHLDLHPERLDVATCRAALQAHLAGLIERIG